MTPEQRIDEIMAKYDTPTKRDVLRALLLFTYQQGKCDGAEEAVAALRKTFEQLELPASTPPHWPTVTV